MYYDVSNTKKSFKGKPTTNLVVTIPYTITNYAYCTGPVAIVVKDAEGQMRTVNRYTVNTAAQVARARVVLPSTTTAVNYAFSCKIKYNGTTAGVTWYGPDASKGNPEGSNNTYTTNTASYTAIGNGWNFAKQEFSYATNPTSGGWMCYGPIGAAVGETFDVYEEQFEVQTYATTYANGVRSVSQSLYDLTGSTTVDVTSTAWDSDSNIIFNGSSSSYLVTPAASFNMYCLDMWFYNNNIIPGNDTAIGGPSTYQSLIAFNAGYPDGVNLGGWTGGMTNEAIHIWSSITAATNTRDAVAIGWHNVVFNWNGSSYDIWVDKVKATTYSYSGTTHAGLVSLSSAKVGRANTSAYFFNGKIPVVKMYNRSLSDAEIGQNFNATRGRYGL
jgi:hypothetical protein